MDFFKFPRAVKPSCGRAKKPHVVVQALEGRILCAREHLVFIQQPTDVMVGNPIVPPIEVDVENSLGNVVARDESNVTLTISTGTLNGAAATTAINGVAVFSNLSIDAPGGYTLTATDGLDVPAISNLFSVMPDRHLAFASPPVNSVVGAMLAPVTVLVEDPAGDVVTNSDSFVSLSANGGSLAGVTTVPCVNGQAVFDDVSVETPGAVTLSASAGRIEPATSASFTIAPTPIVPETLAPTIAGSSLPLTAVAGEQVNGAVRVFLTDAAQTREKGLAAVSLFASADDLIDSASVLLTRRSVKVNLKPGQSTGVMLAVEALPASLSNGTYMLLPQSIDPNQNTSDGVIGPALVVQPPAANLAGNVDPVFPATIHVNHAGFAPVTIINNGNVAFSGTIQFAVGLSADGVSDADELTTLSHKLTVPAGQSRDLLLRFVVTAPAAGGSYFPFVSITADGVVTSTVGETVFTVVG